MKNHSTPKKAKAVKRPYPEDHYIDFLCERGYLEKIDGQLTMKPCVYILEYLNAEYKKKFL